MVLQYLEVADKRSSACATGTFDSFACPLPPSAAVSMPSGRRGRHEVKGHWGFGYIYNPVDSIQTLNTYIHTYLLTYNIHTHNLSLYI